MVDNPLFRGAQLDKVLSEELKLKLMSKFGIKLSKRPAGEKPSDDWAGALIESGISSDNDREHRRKNYYLNWWPQFTENEKAWACYYSTFDELVPVLELIGFSEDHIMHKPITSKFSGSFGEFGVKIFKPYCDSIR